MLSGFNRLTQLLLACLTCCIPLSVVQASNWIPVGEENFIFVPNPSLEKTEVEGFQLGSSQAVVDLGDIGITSLVYYQYARTTDGVTFGSYGDWQCQDLTTLNANNNDLKFSPNNGTDPVNGIYKVNIAAVMVESSCDAATLAKFEAGELMSSAAVETTPFVFIEDDQVSCSSVTSGECLRQNPVEETRGESKRLSSYDLFLNWPVVDGVSEYKLTLTKDEVPHEFTVTPSEFDSTSSEYQILDVYDSATGFTPYTGFGKYSFKVQYCFAGQCSAPLSYYQELVVKPLYPTLFSAYAGGANGTSDMRMMLKTDRRVPSYKVNLLFAAEGTTTGLLNTKEQFVFPMTAEYLDRQVDGEDHYFYTFVPPQDGKYKYQISPCDHEGICEMFISQYDYSAFSSTINNDINVPIGDLLDFAVGDDVINGWVIDGDTSSTYFQFTAVQNGVSATLHDPLRASYTVNLGGELTDNGFVLGGFQAKLLNAGIDINAPFDLQLLARDFPGFDYVVVKTMSFYSYFNQAPVANDDSVTSEMGLVKSFNLIANDTDLEGQALTIVNVNSSANANVTINADGTVTYAPTVLTSESATDTFTYQVKDEQDVLSNVATVTVTFSDFNHAPTMSMVSAVTTDEDTATDTINFSVADLNDASNVLTVSFVSSSNVALLTESGVAITGTGTNRTMILRPELDVYGTSTLLFRVSDGEKSSNASLILTVNSVNDLPTAGNGNVVTIEDNPVVINLSGYDADGDGLTYNIVNAPTNGNLTPDGSHYTYTPAPDYTGSDSFSYKVFDGTGYSSEAVISIMVTEVNDIPVASDVTVTTDEDNGVTFSLVGTDKDGDPLTYQMISSATNGTLSTGNGATRTYTPNSNFNGSESISYVVNDGMTNSQVATLTINVQAVNDTPLAYAQSVSLGEGDNKVISLTGTDIDGDSLTYRVTTPATHGTLDGNGNTLTYFAGGDFNGSDSFSYVVNDGTVDSEPKTVSISVNAVNDQPLAYAQTVSLSEDGSLAITLLGSDIDGDPLTYVISGQPFNGSLSGNGANLTYTPVADFNGVDNFSYVVNDGTVDSEPKTVSLTVTGINDAPMAYAQAISLNEDGNTAIVLVGTDVDGDSLTYSVSKNPTNGTLSGSGANLIYTANPDFNGVDDFNYVVNDGTLNSAAQTVSITVNAVNDAPVISSSHADSNITAGDLYSYQVMATDVDGDSLSYSLTSEPTGMTMNASGLIQWTPTNGQVGEHVVSVNVSDGSASDSQSFTLTVDPLALVNNVDIANLDIKNGNFTVNWDVDYLNQQYKLTEEYDSGAGVVATEYTVTNSNSKDFSGKAAGRYRYKVETCVAGVCGDGQTSVAVVIGNYSGVDTMVADTTTDFSHLNHNVGFTKGQFRVSESGGATYAIPLALPDGVTGVKPQVSFNYSSQAGGGNMGHGWSVSTGGGAITRCSPNIYHNGSIDTVKYDNSDIFCLNGEQLMNLSGNNGTDGSTYVLRLDDFSLITAHGQAADSGPEYFTVENKAGETWYYGWTTDADDNGDAFINPNFESGNNEIAKFWALKKIVDVAGNTIRYHYNEDQTTGSFSVANIEYGKNENVASSRYFANVAFNYLSHPKPRAGYQGGSPVLMDELLDSVTITVDGESFRHYDLAYAINHVIEDKTYLETVTECIAADSNCLAPLSFTWQRPLMKVGTTTTVTYCEPGSETEGCVTYEKDSTADLVAYSAEQNLNNDSTAWYTSRMLDFNGDGYSDIVFEEQGWKVLYGPDFNAPAVHFSNIAKSDNDPTTPEPDRDRTLIMDTDGDGAQELLLYGPENSSGERYWLIAKNGDTPGTSVSSGIKAPASVNSTRLLDINGDGLVDIVTLDSGKIRYYRNRASQGFAAGMDIGTLSDFTGPTTSVITADGDETAGDSYLEALEGSHTSYASVLSNSASADFNGDGRSDIILSIVKRTTFCAADQSATTRKACEGNNIGTWEEETSYYKKLLLAGGAYTNPSLSLLGAVDYDASIIKVTDLNGDGLSDLVYRKGMLDDDSDDAYWYYRMSMGNKMGEEHKTNEQSSDAIARKIAFTDLNGDGRADILKPDATSGNGHYSMLLSRAVAGEQMIVWEKRGEVPRYNDRTMLMGDVNGDGKGDMLTAVDDTGWKVSYALYSGIINDVITDFTNGWGVNTKVTYDTLLSDSVLATNHDGSTVTNHVIDETIAPKGPMPVVRRVESDVTDSSSMAVEYRYAGMLMQYTGLGSLGFRVLSTTDMQTGVVSTTEYNQEYPFVGMPLNTYTKTADDRLMNTSINTLAQQVTANGGTMVYIADSTQTEYQIDTNDVHHQLMTTVTTNQYDNWGNNTFNEVIIQDDSNIDIHTTTTTSSFEHSDISYQQKGRLVSSTITKTLSGGTPITRASTFEYFNGSESCEGYVQPKGMLKSATVAGLTESSCYNTFGYEVKATKTALLNENDSSVTSIHLTSSYSADGRMISTTTNAQGHTSTSTYNGQASSGAVTGNIQRMSLSDEGNINTTSHYDIWGREVALVTNLAPTKQVETVYCDSCTDGSKYYVETAQPGTPTKRVIFDRFGREIASRIVNFDGTGYVYKFKDYDNQGRILKEYLPSASPVRVDSANHYSKYIYDLYSRVIRTELPNSGDHGYVHPTVTIEGAKVTTQDAKGQILIETKNFMGDIIEVVDHLGNELSYTYDAFGNMLSATKHADGDSLLQFSRSYDAYGRNTGMNDLDKGVWQYGYNGFGKLIWTINGRNETSRVEYDSTGRKVRLFGYDYTQCIEYGGTGNGIGKVVARKYSTVGNKACDSGGFEQINQIEFDAKGRPSGNVVTIDGLQSQLNGVYRGYTEYDDFGRAYKQHYPGTGLSVRQEYNPQGHVYKTVNDVTGRVYSETTSVNIRGQATEVKYANNVTEVVGYDDITGMLNRHHVNNGSTVHALDYRFDAIGNLIGRDHQFGPLSDNADMSESYDYDGLNRLKSKSITVATQGSTPSDYTVNQTYSYDGFGNFTHKGGTGYYQYNANKQLTGIYNNAAFSGTALYHFSYDDNGNVVHDGNRTIVYASFDKPVMMGYDGTSKITEFAYGLNHKRYYRHDLRMKDGAQVDTYTAYLGALEKAYRTSSSEESIDLIEYKVTVGNIVITERSNALSAQETNEHYLHKDHLGSPLSITNESGIVVQQNVYDPWGKVRQLYFDTVGLSDFRQPTTRGFTGHEGIEGIDIIHMNGRIYDANIGRFLQADPHIQAPKNSQNYNRYSYVLNNPLSHTDPSGYFFNKLFKGLNKAFGKFAPYVGIALMFIPGMQGFGWALAKGFIAGGIASGSLKGALIGAFSAAVFYQIGQHYETLGKANVAAKVAGLKEFGGNMLTSAQIAGQIASHAFVGGVISTLNGGKFGHGFVSAGVTKAAGGVFLPSGDNLTTNEIASGTIASALIGGTASAISGGKFANGARTAAFQYVFNQVGRNIFRHPFQDKIDEMNKMAEQWEQKLEQMRSEFALELKLLGISVKDQAELALLHAKWIRASFVESRGENITIKAGGQVAMGAGMSAFLTEKLNGEIGYEYALAKGFKLEFGGSIGGEIYKSGDIQGFFQGLDLCAIGCINIEWNGTDWAFGTSIGPSVGVGVVTGYKGVWKEAPKP